MSHVQQRLQNARAQMDSLHTQYTEVQAEMQAVRTNASEMQRAIEKPASDRVGFLGKLFRSGKKPTQDEIEHLKTEVAEHATATAQAAEVESAKAQALAELEQKHNDIVALMQPVAAEIAHANFDVVREEIEAQFVPEFVRAREQLKNAYAKIIGASRAHQQMAHVIRNEYGASAQGFEMPISPLFTFDIADQAEKIKAELLARWR